MEMNRIVQYKEHDSVMVAVDCIIFGFDGKEIKALLVKRGFEPELGKWSLMGGFVNYKEKEWCTTVQHTT